jgi:hypothetical protein
MQVKHLFNGVPVDLSDLQTHLWLL